MNIKKKHYLCGEVIMMGILNVTPDSFYAASRKQTDEEILSRAREILTLGGDKAIIDVGGCSTRPGSAPVSEEEEMHRVCHALELLQKELPNALISVDTFRPEVARKVVEEYGVSIINDISGNVACAMPDASYVLTSSEADIDAIIRDFRRKIEEIHSLQPSIEVILDPGFGFGKTRQQEYDILLNLHKIKQEFPDNLLLVGVSRKRMIYEILGTTPDSDATLAGTRLINHIAMLQGADIIRTHDLL
ncbi:MAG: dihydropteroate synthase [Prevotella sp.]|nr:dihydropteroate synthase [Prevotella sp.]MBR4522248.1 dihydropteroate synthase [Prevotella sp.]